ncbi:MAG: AEC family transporter [Oscillatoriaceae cyanobacterium]
MIAILSAVFPVGSIVLIGFIAAKTLELHLPTLSRLALYVLFPAMVADSLYRTTLSAQSAAAIVLGCTLTYFAIGLVAWWWGRKLGLAVPLQKSLVTTSVLPNAGNMGLPVNLFALGAPGLDRAVVYMICHSILSVITVPAFLNGGGWRRGLAFTLRLPLIWAVLLGLGLRFSQIELPLKLDRGLQLLGEGTIPLALLVLGVQIASKRFEPGRYEVGASLLRLIGGALMALVVGKGMGISGLDLQVLVLQSAMPCAINSFLMVNEFGGDAARTAQAVVISTLLAFVTLPLVLWAIASL